MVPSVRSCEKIGKSGTDSPFRAGQLRIFKRLRGAKKVSGPGFSIFSQLLPSGAWAGCFVARDFTPLPTPQKQPRADHHHASDHVVPEKRNAGKQVRGKNGRFGDDHANESSRSADFREEKGQRENTQP